jgi:hypothetical protein
MYTVYFKYWWGGGDIVVMIVWKLDLQLLMQLPPSTTNVVSSNLAHDEVYNIM